MTTSIRFSGFFFLLHLDFFLILDGRGESCLGFFVVVIVRFFHLLKL